MVGAEVADGIWSRKERRAGEGGARRATDGLLSGINDLTL